MKYALTLVCIVGGYFGWREYEEYYYTHTDHAYHQQCPNPEDSGYYDCDWWPKS